MDEVKISEKEQTQQEQPERTIQFKMALSLICCALDFGKKLEAEEKGKLADVMLKAILALAGVGKETEEEDEEDEG